jgi:hypothetical protein
MRVGIAGVDENKRIHQAKLALAGEIKGQTHSAVGIAGLNDMQLVGAARHAGLGISGLDRPAKCGVAGPNTRRIVNSAQMGIAGNLKPETLIAFQERDRALCELSLRSERVGDRVARVGWEFTIWFVDFTYVLRKDGEWRQGRELVFGRQHRTLPVFLDSCGFRARLVKTAPKWAENFDVYPRAIEKVDPDGYAAWDWPLDRAKSLRDLDRLRVIFPHDERLWPVFSIRWTWRDDARLHSRLPWTCDLADLIPLNRTQRPFKRETRREWVGKAIANALLMAEDPDFRAMIDTHGQVMLGGMVKGPCPRMARHIFAATLVNLFPGVSFWLLGQASYMVVNGLGMLGILDQVHTDGSWWVQDSRCDRFGVIENNLITMYSMEGIGTTFFTLVELMAANLRSLIGAYSGEVAFPRMPMPIDVRDLYQMIELRDHYRTARRQLDLWPEDPQEEL